MNILVINCGSSSVKFKLLAMPDEALLVSGQVERIGSEDGHLSLRWTTAGGGHPEHDRRQPIADHATALGLIVAALDAPVGGSGVRIEAIGHRVVHGGIAFSQPTRIDAEVLARIEATVPLAPLHNPVNLQGIHACRAHFPGLPQVAVFDTAFHQTMPETAFRYAIPEAWYRDRHVRRYGFHGISHAHVAAAAAAHLGRAASDTNLITLHLGNGASAAAIRGGQCVDTSMGLTPLEGLVMGTRSGDIDPAIPFHLARTAALDTAALDHALNHESGLRGLCGDHDLREIQARAMAGDAAARLAIDIYVYRLRKYIGAYAAVLGRLDALVFTAGVGENAAFIREAVCAGMDLFGIRLDSQRNRQISGKVSQIQAPDAPVKLLVVRTDEELEIARQALACLAAD